MGEIAAEFTGLADSNVFSSLNVLLSYNWMNGRRRLKKRSRRRR
jgi:hypothetical protein